MKIHQDSFDTSLLGCDVYKVLLDHISKSDEIETAIRKIKKGIIFCFTPVESGYITLLEKLQFHLISIRSSYRYIQGDCPVNTLPDGYSVSPYTPQQTVSDTDIKNLAVTIGKETRYFKDPRILESKSKEIYIQWIKNSLYHGFAKQCFIARYKEKPIGICTTKIKDADGEIDLFGVLPEYQNKKIGKHLLVSALNYLRSHNLNTISVVTAGENIKANIFFQRNNFVIHSVNLVYHKHINI